MKPLIGFALTHAEQASLDPLEAVRLEIREQAEQPLFWRRPGAVLVHAKRAGSAGFPIEAPHGHVGAARRFEGGTSCSNSSSVRLVTSKHSPGRSCTSVNRK